MNPLEQQALFEVVMAVGNGTALAPMLQGSLSSMIRKLGCNMGAVTRELDGGRAVVHGIPHRIKDGAEILALCAELDQRDLTARGAVAGSPPAVVEREAQTFMVLPLPGYGRLVLGKAGGALSRAMLGALALIANKLALACIACEQAEAIQAAEQRASRMSDELRQLNEVLEARVGQRTAALSEANVALEGSLRDLKRAQGELIRSEKMAAIGRMVAGVAHELNTPIGNGLMSISTLESLCMDFRETMASGLRRSDLDGFIDSVTMGSGIAARNLQRAAALVASFKQIAVDQTSSQRRSFDLRTITDELLTALRPTLRQTPYLVENRIEPGVTFDSYPGPLEQVLGNLIENAIRHGLDGRASGSVVLAGQPAAGAGSYVVTVSDDGKGIPPDDLPRIFDPFFTTRLGQGGSGLGLSIVQNIVVGLLGGSLDVSSKPGEGACFAVALPRVAPAAVTTPET